MATTSTFTIYNASAGSGKTFTVVKQYLKILVRSQNPLAFKFILALTFTNKAVGEMKERIVETLKSFSNPDILKEPNSMFSILVEELEIEPKTLHKKSKTILNAIAHDYASFDISTIDKFNHQLIRTFAYDLNLPFNFEVELDSDQVICEAVDRLIDKAGTDEELTKVLVDFAIEKADEDKSWDVAYDFNDIAKLLINENEIPHLETLKNKSLDDFETLKTQIKAKLNTIEAEVVSLSRRALELIVNQGLQFKDFSRGSVPNYFQSLFDCNFSVNFGLNWQSDLLEGASLYKSNTPQDVVDTINSIQSELASYFNGSKELIFNYKFLNNVYKNITPLSVLHEIYKTLQELKDEENILLISEFNSIIGNEINKQPVPFIYERIGEKFKHYFIDEFQDTSVMQWDNLIPLIDNALSSETLSGERGSAMLVGDPKQAIYRWRGGKPEQFIDLYGNKNPFHVNKTVENLPTNYRSSKTIISFNNSFFKHHSNVVLANPEHQEIFAQCHQNSSLDKEGFIEISFLDASNNDKDSLYCEAVLRAIHKATSNGYPLGDICIITRKTKEGVTLAEFLSEQNIPIVSSETLLLQNSPEVNFIVNLLSFLHQPKNLQLKMDVLSYLAEYPLNLEDKHAFYIGHIHLDVNLLFEALKDYDFYFYFDAFFQLPFYESVEAIIKSFRLDKTSNAYLQFFLDEVFEYSVKKQSDFSGFLNYWQQKKDRLSIASTESSNAIRIMTIHKSKGLEFPVVIFPYANQDIYFDKNPKVWFPVDANEFNGFSYVYTNLNKDLEEYGPAGYDLYSDYKSKLELDNINLLYVVLTRAIRELYIISELDLDSSGNEKLNRYSGLFINYLKACELWNPTLLDYFFGIQEKVSSTIKTDETLFQSQFISTSMKELDLNILTKSGYLWDTAQEKALERGNLVHLIMSQINTENNINFVIENLNIKGGISQNQIFELKTIVNAIVGHERLKRYFKSDVTIYNEREILTSKGEVVRPDRVVINNKNQAIILDYKTGSEKLEHIQQLLTYQKAMEEMGYEVLNKILVYIDGDIKVKEF